MAKQESCIFGLGCTSLNSASSLYITWLKKQRLKLPSALYLAAAGNFVPSKKPRLIFIDGVNTLFHVIDRLGELDRVIVADSPVLLSEVPHVPLLDIQQNPERQWSYSIKQFNPKDLHTRLERSYKRPIPVASLGWTRKDQLGLLVDNNRAGVISTPYQNLMAQLDQSERVVVRKAVAQWSDSKIDLATLERTIRNKMINGPVGVVTIKSFIDAATQHEALIRTCLPLLKTNRSIKSKLKDQPVTEFEMKFLYRLSANGDE